MHMDIKEANMFVKNGIWFVGDDMTSVLAKHFLPREEIVSIPSKWHTHHDRFGFGAGVFVNHVCQLHIHEAPIE